MRWIFFVFIFFISCNLLFSQNNPVKPTVVIDFENLGEKRDDSVRITIMKSLIAGLARIPGAVIIPFDEVEKVRKEKIAAEAGADKEWMIFAAQSFECRQMISGSYKLNRSEGKITIRIVLTDVATGEVRLERVYEGAVGMDLLDTIDSMSRNVSGLLQGRKILFGKIAVEISESSNTYTLTINGKKTAEITNGLFYSEDYPAEEPVEISLRLKHEPAKEVYRTNFILDAEKTPLIQYRPLSSVGVKNLGRNAALFCDGLKIVDLPQDGECELTLEADREHRLTLEKDQKILSEKKIRLAEGENRITVFTEAIPISGSKNYRNTAIWMNALVPGFAQFQAGDYLTGSIFCSAWVLTVGWTAFSWNSYRVSSEIQQGLPEGWEKQKYQNIQDTWKGFIYNGIGIWAGVVLLSVVHAGSQVSSGISADFQNQNFYVTLEENRVDFNFRY